MTIIEADTVGIHLKEAVWWFKGWCKLQEHEGLVYWLPTYRDNALRHLDLAILELRRSDARDAAIPPLPPFRLDNPPLFGPPELEWAYGEVQDGRGWSPTNLEPS